MTKYNRRDALRLAVMGATAIVAVPLAIVGGTALPALPEPEDENFGGDWPQGTYFRRPVGTEVPAGWRQTGEYAIQVHADGSRWITIEKL